MQKCNVCGSNDFLEKRVRKIFEIDSEIVLVDNIPAKVCQICGEENFSRETLKNLQNLIYTKPAKTVNAKQFDYV